MSFYKKYFNFIDQLDFPQTLPNGVEILNPFKTESTYSISHTFYQKFYSDSKPRVFLIGINPGRFGAGVTGVPFTDPIRLEHNCGISNDLAKRQELSSVFVYDMIHAFGGVKEFYSQVFFTSVSPLGFVKDGRNVNYYDFPEVRDYLEPYMVKALHQQIAIGAVVRKAFCLGQGENFKYLQRINSQHHFFDAIDSLPHPRWVMQYRLRQKQQYLDEYINKISAVLTG